MGTGPARPSRDDRGPADPRRRRPAARRRPASAPSARRAGATGRLLIFLAGLLGALLAPFHFFFFPAFLAAGALYVRHRRPALDSTRLATRRCFLAPYLLARALRASPPLLQAAAAARCSSSRAGNPRPSADGPGAVVFFYLTNLGVPFVLALVALLAARGVPRRGFLAAWAGRPVRRAERGAGQRHRLRHEQVLPGDVDRGRDPRRLADAPLAGAALAGVFALSILSPLLVAAWTAINREQVLSTEQRRRRRLDRRQHARSDRSSRPTAG